MEVHHHAPTSGKKWTHYIWEFLILFLAVFCGFLAEYQLEHKIEKERGRQYIESFYEDLKKDTSNYRWLINTYDKKIKVLSHNYDCYTIIKNDGDFSQCFSELLEWSFGFPDIITEDRTLQQLKSSGTLRLISKQDADSITKYDAQLREQLQGERTGVQEAQTLLRNVYLELFNYDAYHNGFLKNNDRIVLPGTKLINHRDQSKIDRLFSIIARYPQMMEEQYFNIYHLNERAKSLINYFSEIYHFKNWN